MDFLIDSQTIRVVAKALDGTSKRHTAIASNIANAETTGYKGIHVLFEENLKQAIQAENNPDKQSRFLPQGSLKTTSEKHHNPKPLPTSVGEAKAVVDQSEISYGHDQNGVDVEREMAELARNTQRYMALSRLEGKNFNMLRTVIKGGGA
jgi:flagellar basal-body rod protein FlgB